MFTNDDVTFLERLGARSDAALSSADPTTARLSAAIASLRDSVDGQGDVEPDKRDRIETLLDAITWACSSGDQQTARAHAAELAHAVRALGLPGRRAMQVVDAALQIRSLVVLAA